MVVRAGWWVGVVFGVASVAAAEPGVPVRVPLAGEWQARLTAPLPAVPKITNKHKDSGISPAGKAAMAPSAPDADWQQLHVPSPWSKYEGDWATSDGEGIFRRRFILPDGWLGLPLDLHLGSIDDEDLTQINGVTVGKTDATRPGSWAFQRIYTIPPQVLHRGENLLVIRVFDEFGEGGIMGPDEVMYLEPSPMATVVSPQEGAPPKN